MANNRIKLSPPWQTYVREIRELFKGDHEIENITYDAGENVIRMYVNGNEKAEALEAILPKERTFGSVTIKTEVIPSNGEKTTVDMFKRAFANNPNVSKIIEEQYFGESFAFISFENRVVQFFNDQLDDPDGVRSTLYQEIAKDIFQDTGCVFFCTDKEDDCDLQSLSDCGL